MDKSLIEKYKAEMMGMYRSAKKTYTEKSVPTVASIPESEIDSPPTEQTESTGKLIVTVTTVRSLYPLENAEVTVFSGDISNKKVIARDFTDQSGRTNAFTLETPQKSISFDSETNQIPYATYNIETKAEGYTDTIHLNVPVFSGVTSIQRVNMMLLETAGKDKGPIIIDEAQAYTLNGDER